MVGILEFWDFGGRIVQDRIGYDRRVVCGEIGILVVARVLKQCRLWGYVLRGCAMGTAF